MLLRVLVHRVEPFEGVVTVVSHAMVVIVHAIVLALMPATVDTPIKVFVAVVDLHVMVELASMQVDSCQTVSRMVASESETMVVFAPTVVHAEIVQAEHVARRVELEAAFYAIGTFGEVLLRQVRDRLVIVNVFFVQFDLRDLDVLFVFRWTTSLPFTVDVVCVGFLMVDIELIDVGFVVAFVGDDCD